MQKYYSLNKPQDVPVYPVSIDLLNSPGKWMKVMKSTLRRVHDDKVFHWEVLSKKSAVSVLPITKENEIILIDQFRYPIMDWELECPAETMDEMGDTPESAAIRALTEEIGYQCDRLLRVATYASSGGTTDELSYGFLALDCIPLESGHSRSDDEIIRVNHVPLSEIDLFLSRRVSDGQIINPKMDALIGRFQRGFANMGKGNIISV